MRSDPRPAAVLILHSSDELYGSDRTLLDTVRTLDRARFEPIVILPRDGGGEGSLSKVFLECGYSVHKLNLAVLRRRYFNPLGIVRLAARATMDIYHLSRLVRRYSVRLCYSNSSAVVSGSLVAKLLGIPHVWHVREIVVDRAGVGRGLRLMINNLSSSIIVVSNAVQQWLAPSKRTVDVIYHGFDAPLVGDAARSTLRAELALGREGPLIGWIGRISNWKGHDDFVSMAERVAERFPEATFVLVGGSVPGSESLVIQLNQRLKASPYADRIRYLGFRADGPALVSALDVLVACPTRPDPFPRVVQEAMWQGVPVLATATGGLPELVIDGVTGRLVKEARPGALAHSLANMLDDRVALKQMAEASRAIAVERYSMRKYVARIESVFDRALTSRS